MFKHKKETRDKHRMNKIILVCISGGGHTEQACRVIKDLKDKFSFEYVVEKGDLRSMEKFHGEKIFKINRSRKYGQNLFLSIPSQIKSLFNAFNIIRKTKAKAILSFGASFSPYLCLLGKINKKKIIFVESWSRVNSKSLSGKITYRIADLFFVQWEKQKQNYPKAIYVGRLG